jgi:DNA-binding NarL/FixJ family response regulator
MLKLLVVEDHALVREGLVRLLSQIEEDVQVFDSPDFESALSKLDNEGEFDLLLLDLALPGIDGFAGLDILRRRYPSMPVAVVSAYDDTPTVTRVMNLVRLCCRRWVRCWRAIFSVPTAIPSKALRWMI